MTHLQTARTAMRLARREMRSGLKGFGVFLACLFLGVAVISSVGNLSESLKAGLQRDAGILLGGDVEIRLTHRGLTPEQERFVRSRAQRFSEVVTLRAMVRTSNGTDAVLVELKGVDRAYPLFGDIDLDPDEPLSREIASGGPLPGAVADQGLVERLGLEPGDVITIGDADFQFAAVLQSEPDRTTSLFSLGPRVMVGLDSLRQSGILDPGSLVRYAYRLELPQGLTLESFEQELKEQFPQAGWQVRSARQAVPRIQFFLERMTVNLTLIGLTALLVGGLGVLSGVRGYLSQKMKTIAIIKCLGGTTKLLVTSYLAQIIALALVGSLAGIVVGAAVPFVFERFFADQLPLPMQPGIYVEPLILAGVYGVLIAFLFSIKELGRAGMISPAVLFRGEGQAQGKRAGKKIMFALLFGGIVLGAVIISSSSERETALWFAAGAGICLVIFRLLGAAFVRGVRRLPRPTSPGIRLGIMSAGRPGSSSGLMVFSLGLGLTALITIVQVQYVLRDMVEQNIPDMAPSYFLIDIQPGQLEDLDRVLEDIPGVVRFERMGQIRGRIVRINGVDVEQAEYDQDVSWAVRGDRSLTWAKDIPAGSTVSKGKWWPEDYSGSPLISLTADLARGFGLNVGDTLTVNILGRNITAQIANLREVEWTTLALQFAIIFSPGVLESAPLSYIGTVYARPGAETEVYVQTTTEFPGIGVVRIRDVLERVGELLSRIGNIYVGMSLITLGMGFFVLAGLLSADQSRRIYEMVVLKVCGGTRRQILLSYLTEFALIGVAAGTISALVGLATGYAVVTWIMEIRFVPSPLLIGATILGALAGTMLFGIAGTARILARSPAPYLRNE
ncbi:MAG: ABC transporter permease [Desulfovibrionales bacterium]